MLPHGEVLGSVSVWALAQKKAEDVSVVGQIKCYAHVDDVGTTGRVQDARHLVSYARCRFHRFPNFGLISRA